MRCQQIEHTAGGLMHTQKQTGSDNAKNSVELSFLSLPLSLFLPFCFFVSSSSFWFRVRISYSLLVLSLCINWIEGREIRIAKGKKGGLLETNSILPKYNL